MREKSKEKKRQERKRRFEAIKDLMSTFTMGTIAVVAVVTLIPSSPKAEIIKSVALEDEIVYQVNVTDADNALDLSTLSVVLENQLEYYEKPISLGENSGYFANLTHSTEYRLSVYGSKGFGQERLDTVMIVTNAKIGGTILAVTPETAQYETSYSVDISIYDPNLTYSSIVLYYGYSWEQGSELMYSSIPITEQKTSIELYDIYTSLPFHVYLEGTTIDGQEILDEIWVTPPFELYTSVYPHYINSEEIAFSIYNDMDVGDVSYLMKVYKNDFLMQTKEFIVEQFNYEQGEYEEEEYVEYEEALLVIDNLIPNTLYYFECTATFKNPNTLRQESQVVYQEKIQTLDTYTYTYSKEIINDTLQVTITLNDPNDYFQYVDFEVYDTSGPYDMYVDSGTNWFESIGINKTVTFTILLPSTTSYKITVTLRSQNDYLITDKIDIITSK